MIGIEPYTKAFEEEYWKAVNSRIDRKTKRRIMKSCIKFLPDGFFEPGKVSFKELVLAPFEKLKMAQEHMKNNTLNTMIQECYQPGTTDKREKSDIKWPYDKLYHIYEAVAGSHKNKMSMRVRLVKNTGLTVCPYCNRDYINCRDEETSGAQLDHFFSRVLYPVFSVCLYNLVPVCANCNRIKSDSDEEFASPFDGTIDWEKSIVFSCDLKSVNVRKISITAIGPVKRNISKMRIEEAYQIHDAEVKELLEKVKMYPETQMEEFRKTLGKLDLTNLTDHEIKQAVFGPKITPKAMRTKPLGKMMSDLHKQLGIY